MTQSFETARRPIGVLSLVLISFLMFVPQEANGQPWLQTSQVITPVEQGAVRVLLDSLVNVMKRRSLQARRSVDSDSRMTASRLRSTLINEEGIGIRSASHAFIDYRLFIDNRGNFRQQVAAIRFVYRPGPDQADVPILYLDAQNGWMDTFMRTKGTELKTNEAIHIPFDRRLDFTRIARQEESEVAEIGGQTVRKDFDRKKEALLQKLERLVYEMYG